MTVPHHDPTGAALLALIAGRIGAARVLVGEAAAPFCTDWRGLLKGEALAVICPGDTQEVAACVALCAAHGAKIVPQGGNTGQCGGATPMGGEIVLSLSRLNRVREVDATDMVLVADAGVTLQAAREVAGEWGLDLPIGIASEGSAQLGGILATNAGGTSVLRYGSARDQVLGMEVVLADGRVWNGLRRLRKDNAGYALRQLFAGSEGTLGIITGACLRLVPAARTTEVAFAAVPSVAAALSLLNLLRHADVSALTACEYISGAALRLALARIAGLTDPLSSPPSHAVLIEFSSPREGAPLRGVLEAVLADALAAGHVTDAVIAASEAQREALWRLRESLPEAQRRTGATIRNDISVPLSRLPALIEQASAACAALVPGIRILPFGHIGDGNIHFNLLAPEGADAKAFVARIDELMHAVGEVARSLDGSFSAEHGIGQLKTALLAEWRGGVELDLFQALKTALDPQRQLNPGKILSHKE